MKKVISVILTCGLLTTGAAAFAEDGEMLLTAAPEQKEYSVVINNEKLNLGESKVFESEKNIMLPLRKVAEKLGFKVEWNDERKGVTLDDGTVNTTVYIGEDTYYMASSIAIGMSAPTPLGTAPVLKNSTTYVPAELFNVLNCGEAYTVKDNVITFQKAEDVQIPNPLKEYKSVAEAKSAVGFEAKVPTKLPQGYELTYIGTISDETFELTYENGENEITYRTAKGKDDISGDYNVYKETKNIKAGNLDVLFRANAETASAVWQDGDFTFSVYADKAITEKEMTDIILSIL
mgnify:CR=1 FL=1